MTEVGMAHYLYLTVKEISTGCIGFVIDVSEDSLLVEFPSNSKWLKEDEIIELGL